MNENQKTKTVFVGYVNGKKFTDRKAMNQFIGECISSGVEINNMSYSQTTGPVDALETTPTPQALQERTPACACAKSWDAYIQDINTSVPKPYTSVLGYLIPFIEESLSFANSDTATASQQDVETKLTNRMEWAEANIISKIRTWEYNVNEVKAWVFSAIENLRRKSDWANMRVEQIHLVLDAVTDNRHGDKDTFISDRVDTTTLDTYSNIYEQVAGYCKAMSDILADTIR